MITPTGYHLLTVQLHFMLFRSGRSHGEQITAKRRDSLLHDDFSNGSRIVYCDVLPLRVLLRSTAFTPSKQAHINDRR